MTILFIFAVIYSNYLTMNESEILEKLQCVYPINEVEDEINKPITIYEGSLDVRYNDEQDQEINTNCENCTISFIFQPYPQVELCIKDYFTLTKDGNSGFNNKDIKVRFYDSDFKFSLINIAGDEDYILIRFCLNNNTDEIKPSIDKALPQNKIKYIKFSLLNLNSIFHNLSYNLDLSENLKIIIRKIMIDDKKIQLLDSGKYGITHFGLIELNSNQHESLESKNITDSLDFLMYFFSFLQGYWVSPCLIAGFDTNDNKIWEWWQPIRQPDLWRYSKSRYGSLSWFSTIIDMDKNMSIDHPNCVQKIFDGFQQKWNNELWKEPIKLGINWYIESNKKSGRVEGSIIFIQAALEMFSWVLLVEDKALITKEDFEQYHAAQKITHLLRECKISIEIPEKIKISETIIESLENKNSPTLLTYIRNKITHPSPKNRKQLSEKVSDEDMENTYRLGRWLLELTLLSLFNYNGKYMNCSSLSCTRDLVPWATPQE